MKPCVINTPTTDSKEIDDSLSPEDPTESQPMFYSNDISKFDTTYIFKNAAESCGTFNYNNNKWDSQKKKPPDLLSKNEIISSQPFRSSDSFVERTYDEPCVEIINETSVTRSRSWLCCPGGSNAGNEIDASDDSVMEPELITTRIACLNGEYIRSQDSLKILNEPDHQRITAPPICMVIEHVCCDISYIRSLLKPGLPCSLSHFAYIRKRWR